MKDLYSMAIITENKFKEEITLPPGTYCINNKTDLDDGLINLNIPDIIISVGHIEIELCEDNYHVSSVTYDNKSVTEKTPYNSSFFYQGKCLFAIKKQKEKWNDNILKKNKKRNKARCNNMKNNVIIATLMLSSILVICFTYWFNSKIINEKKADYADIIKRYNQRSEYITRGNNILIFTTDNDMIDYVKKELPDYNIHQLNENTLKINKNDIIAISEINNKKQIIHISNKRKNINNDILNIPETFRSGIVIKSISFGDIVELINNRFEHKLTRYSIEKSKNNIIIYSKKRRPEEINKSIHDINAEIFSARGNTLVQHREISNKERHPGVYGTDNYHLLSDNHIKFISDNK
ncbi:MAG: PrgH/EprH family type III secretion apparatus protein [Morganella sp. (in: enterobacteria)]